MTDERQLHCFTNGTDTVSAYSVEDAHAWFVTEYDTAPEDMGELVPVPDDKVLTIAQEDVPLFSECECATWVWVNICKTIHGHHPDCRIASPRKTAREWAAEGRGLVCSTEW